MGLSEIQRSFILKYFNDPTTWNHDNKNDNFIKKDMRILKSIKLINEIIGFPRHLGQHVGGFIMTENKLTDLVPIENTNMRGRTVISWDKDDIDALNILKVDILSLGMLTCIRKSFGLIKETTNLDYSLYTIPKEDKMVYEMLF